MHSSTVFLGASLLSGILAAPTGHLESRATLTEAQRAQAVKDGFTFAWNGYVEFAFPHDELHPVSNTFGDSRNGWGASAVDALSTAIVMEDSAVVDFILDFVPTIDFNFTATEISLFETTIRYIAGLLAGYDLLTGPLAHLTNKTSEVQSLLSQAQILANNLAFAFDTPSGVPSNNLFINQTTDGSTTTGLAVAGSLVMEWTHLSDLTGNPLYGQLAQKGESFLLNPKPTFNEPFPGLLGTNIDLTTGEFLDASGGWVGGDDSFYEYLIKMYVYDTTRFSTYRDRWILAAESSIEHLASHPASRPDLTFLAEYNNKTLVFESEHLACFDGGNFILGGLVLKRQDILNFGLTLVDACHDTYNQTATGIGPESFSWNTTTLPADQVAFFDRAGFWIDDSLYDLRPEVVESYYYAYRATKDPKYQDWSWDAFVAINASTRANSGYSEISDVNTPGGGTKDDLQESFLFAEVMKYTYLIHAPDAVYQVESGGVNNFVFNTEAHPFKVAGPPV